MGQIRKSILQEYNEDAQDWNYIYPRTSGDMIEGQVENAKLLDGKSADKYMPSTFDEFLEVKGDDDKLKGIACKKLIISNDTVDESKLTENSLWVKGKGYISAGKEIATTEYVDKQCSKAVSEAIHTKVDASVLADVLANPRKINDVVFDGSKDIIITMFIFSSSMPSATAENIAKLWINTSEGTLHYYFNGKWNPIIGEWSDY